MFSHSATSLTTDALASSEQNGVLTNGDSKFCRGRGSSQLSITAVAGDPTPSSHLHTHQARKPCPDMMQTEH